MDEAHRIQIVRDYVRYCVESKDVRVTRFHYKHKPYSRKQSTIDLIKRARERKIIFEPRILCIPDTEVEFVEYENTPIVDLYLEKKDDPEVSYVMALAGAYSLIFFKKGKRTLIYTSCVVPSYPALIHFDQIDPTKYEKEKLPVLSSPENWDELDWKVFHERRNPIASSVKIGRKLGVSYQTVLTRYDKILKDCQIWIPFFPNRYSKYVPYVVTLNTEYETGLVSELKKLDRSSYVYKADNTLILTLFFDRRLEINSFLRLQKIGVIHDVRVSFPLRYYSKFW